MPDPAPGLRFVPDRVDGLPDVTEAAVFPDRLELLSAGSWVVVRFDAIGEWARLRWLKWLLGPLGWRPECRMVADRDWFHAPPGKFFRFFARPPITVCLPADPPGTEYMQTLFRRVQDVLGEGGFGTYDLG